MTSEIPFISDALAEIRKLKAENERLREALEEIESGRGCVSGYSGCDSHCRQVARAALEGK